MMRDVNTSPLPSQAFDMTAISTDPTSIPVTAITGAAIGVELREEETMNATARNSAIEPVVLIELPRDVLTTTKTLLVRRQLI